MLSNMRGGREINLEAARDRSQIGQAVNRLGGQGVGNRRLVETGQTVEVGRWRVKS